MIIALTGASGHIGANLCRELLHRQHQLKVMCNRYTASLEGLELQRINGNVLDQKALEELAVDAEIFIHLAAGISISGRKGIMDTNLQGTVNAIAAAREAGVKRFIHFSSIHALVQHPLDQPLDESRPLALDDPVLYNRSKALAERAVQQAVDDGLEAVIIHPTSVMGPNDFRPSLIGQAMLQLYHGQIPALIPGGYDWVDVRDVVSGTISAMEQSRPGNAYLLSGHFLSLKDLYTMIRQLRGNGRNLPVIPFWLAGVGLPFLKTWSLLGGNKPLYTRETLRILKSAHTQISSGKAERELGYRSRPLEETLRDTFAWYREMQYLSST